VIPEKVTLPKRGVRDISGDEITNETIEEALKALSYSIPFIYSINGSNVTITMKNNFSDNKLILE